MSNNKPSSISIKNLSLSFGSTKVLKNINLDIKSGEFFSFLGPSGSGKSTLLRSIAGFGPKPEGTITIGGINIVDTPTWERNIGLVFQNYALWPHMTVWKNVAFGLEEKRVPVNEIGILVDEALDLVELKHLANRTPSQLSGGQQQRIALARTIVVKPRVLLLDEPLSNLDSNLRIQMRRDILSLQRRLNLTTIFVTHDQEEANTVSDRIAVIDNGVIQQIGKPVELYDNPANYFVASFLGTINILEGAIKQGVFLANCGLTFTTSKPNKSSISLIIRPQSIQLFQSNSSKLSMIGKIKNSEFLGETLRYFIDVNGQEIVSDVQHYKTDNVMSRNTEVSMFINENHTAFL